MNCSPQGSSVHGDSPGKNTEVGCHFLLQGIFPTQGLNPGLPHCRQMLYCLSHQGSPKILVSVGYPFSRGSSQPRNPTGVSCIAGGSFTSWADQRIRTVLGEFNKHSLGIYYEVGIFSQEHKTWNENNQFCLNNNWQVNHLHRLNGTDQRELN